MADGWVEDCVSSWYESLPFECQKIIREELFVTALEVISTFSDGSSLLSSSEYARIPQSFSPVCQNVQTRDWVFLNPNINHIKIQLDKHFLRLLGPSLCSKMINFKVTVLYQVFSISGFGIFKDVDTASLLSDVFQALRTLSGKMLSWCPVVIYHLAAGGCCLSSFCWVPLGIICLCLLHLLLRSPKISVYPFKLAQWGGLQQNNSYWHLYSLDDHWKEESLFVCFLMYFCCLHDLLLYKHCS